jgi:hypothetical protein
VIRFRKDVEESNDWLDENLANRDAATIILPTKHLVFTQVLPDRIVFLEK